MELAVDTSGQPARVGLAGEVTIYAAGELKDCLIRTLDSTGGIDVDLAQVTEIDTAGLQVMILAKRHAEQTGKTLHLTAHSRPVLEIIELYGLAGFFGDPLVIPADAVRQEAAR